MKTRPIFVLGLQRSGTTWIGNLLEAHPDVAAVAAPRHQGIHESLFFSHFARAWDWSDPSQRDAALDAFLKSDYAKLMQLHDGEQQEVRAARSAAETFETAMGLLAWSLGAKAWVEKSPHHTRHAEEIAQAIPDATFVAIHRDTASLLASRLRAYGRTPPAGLRRGLAILRGAVSNAYHKRLVDRLEKKFPGRVIRLDYETFKAGGDAAVADLLNQLGLEGKPGLAPRFQANSSFLNSPTASRALPRADRLVVRMANLVVKLVPAPVVSSLRAVTASRKIVFPAWVWADAADRPADIDVATPRPARPQSLRPAQS